MVFGAGGKGQCSKLPRPSLRRSPAPKRAQGRRAGSRLSVESAPESTLPKSSHPVPPKRGIRAKARVLIRAAGEVKPPIPGAAFRVRENDPLLYGATAVPAGRDPNFGQIPRSLACVCLRGGGISEGRRGESRPTREYPREAARED